MEKISLIPKKSYENFILGDDITNYLHLPYHMKSSDDPIVYDVYYFDNLNFDIWQGKNLIGMLYDDFLALINYQQPDKEEILYVPVDRDRGQNQTVYTFDHLGLMVWVWRKKIRTVLISNYEDE